MGGAGNEGIGGGREKAGALALPAESVRGGVELESLFCILSGPTVGVSGSLPGRKKSSSSGRPCLRPSILAYAGRAIRTGSAPEVRYRSADGGGSFRCLFLAAGAGPRGDAGYWT